jgi:hypothetical protein
MQPDLFGSAGGRTDSQAVLEETEADYTPEAVVVQLLLALQERGFGAGGRVLDPSAGSGVWGRAVRAVFGSDVHLVGVERRVSEAANLAAAYDDHAIGEALGPQARPHGPFDLVVTNPPFSAFEEYWPTSFRDRGLLADGAVVAFYGLTQWGQAAEAAEHLRTWSPSSCLRVGGRVGHRGDRRADAREYCLWIWDTEDGVEGGGYRRGAKWRPGWHTEQLPVLPVDMRHWSPDQVPGTRPIDQSLVDLIRRRYL